MSGRRTGARGPVDAGLRRVANSEGGRRLDVVPLLTGERVDPVTASAARQHANSPEQSAANVSSVQRPAHAGTSVSTTWTAAAPPAAPAIGWPPAAGAVALASPARGRGGQARRGWRLTSSSCRPCDPWTASCSFRPTWRAGNVAAATTAAAERELNRIDRRQRKWIWILDGENYSDLFGSNQGVGRRLVCSARRHFFCSQPPAPHTSCRRW
jgi:hypothetical protein